MSISSPSQPIVILDSRVDDLHLLLDGLQPGIAAYVLHPQEDGIAQIDRILAQHPVSTLTLVAHGFPGGLQLGSGTLELGNLHRYAAQLQIWFEGSQVPHLTLLACRVAAEDAGTEFVEQLQILTGAQIAASRQPQGNGNWLDAASATFTPNTLSRYTPTLSISLLDEDRPSIPLVTTSEFGSSDIINVVLTEQPTKNVTVTLTSSNPNEGVFDLTYPNYPWDNKSNVGFAGKNKKDETRDSKITLHFTADNWDRAQSVKIIGVDDTNRDGNIAYTIQATSRSNDPRYNITTPVTINVTNIDNETPWDKVGSGGFSAGEASYIDLEFNGSTAYVVYRDDGNGSKATVKQFNGSTWVDVGAAGFSAGEASYTQLEFNGSTPYVAYQDKGNGSKATVKQFNGSTWVDVGAAGFSAGEASDIDLQFNGSTPYVSYRDNGNGGKATVKQFNGSTWVDVGTAGFSKGQASRTDLEFNGSTPYVVYRDWPESIHDSQAVVMKFNGSSWERVGPDDLWVMYRSSFTDLEFNGSTPYVFYADGLSGRAEVLKFNGSSWETLGNRLFTSRYTSYIDLEFNGSTPYVAYRDKGQGNKAVVMKFNGSTWETASISPGAASYIDLEFNGSTPYVAYRDEDSKDNGNDYRDKKFWHQNHRGNGNKATNKATLSRLDFVPTDVNLPGTGVTTPTATPQPSRLSRKNNILSTTLTNGTDTNDRILGNIGTETFLGGDADVVKSSTGSEILREELGNETLTADRGENTLFGNLGDDRIDANAENGVIFGSLGNDTVIGSSGEDLIRGDWGDDLLIGGIDADRFVFRPGDGNDIVFDFQDRFDLIGLTQGLTFEQLQIIGVGTDTQVSADGLTITLKDLPFEALDASDFVLV